MSFLEEALDRLKFRKRRKAPPPVIYTRFGEPVTEAARYQAALIMREDPKVMEGVFAIILRECMGNMEQARNEIRRRYPEAFEK